MKTRPSNILRHRRNGSAVLVLLILLVIMTLLATANSSALLHLRHELRLLDQRQVQRLKASPPHAIAAGSPAQPESK